MEENYEPNVCQTPIFINIYIYYLFIYLFIYLFFI